MLKSSVADLSLWDEELPSVVITYNTTYHSQIQMSPSQCILTKSHTVTGNFPVEAETEDAWKPGHPNFLPFKIDQRVIKKIHRVGNQLMDKLLAKFEGPFVVTKVQKNGMSYEITGGSLGNIIVKVNHRHLRVWCDYPHYITRYLSVDDINALDCDTVRDDLFSVKDFVSDLSDGVRYNLLGEASIVSD